MPTLPELVEALLAVVAENQGVSSDELCALVAEHLGVEPDADLDDLLEHAVTEAVEHGPLQYIVPDRLVHRERITDGIILTHRLTETERRLDVLEVGLDLGWSRARQDPVLPDGEEIVAFSEAYGHAGWEGPEGWLARWEEGTLLAIRLLGGTVEVSGVDEEPAVDPALVASLRAAYDLAVAEPWLPVTGEELLLEMLAADPAVFSVPRPPLSDLCEAAGLERRGSRVAHEESVWQADAEASMHFRVLQRVHGDAARAAVEAIETGTLEDPGELAMRKALTAMRDLDVAGVVLDEIAPVDFPDAEGDGRANRWAERLLAIASKPGDVALARWAAAVVAERTGEVLVAEQHIALALEADPEFAVAIDWAAWYASDRGDAASAWRLWHLLNEPNAEDLRVLEPFTRTAGRTPGRNDPCWCGSGRKYKTCHLGEPSVIPLHERVPWLCRKAVAYLERRGGQAIEDFADAAAARAVDPDDEDSVADAMEDPLTFDVVLVEGAWFEEFLADRGPLLPEDEANLADVWMDLPRTVYQVDEAGEGDTIEVKDLATGEVTVVRAASLPFPAGPGALVCGRAVPDGSGFQFVGAVLPVPPGEAEDVLALCEAAVPEDICAWAAEQQLIARAEERGGA